MSEMKVVKVSSLKSLSSICATQWDPGPSMAVTCTPASSSFLASSRPSSRRQSQVAVTTRTRLPFKPEKSDISRLASLCKSSPQLEITGNRRGMQRADFPPRWHRAMDDNSWVLNIGRQGVIHHISKNIDFTHVGVASIQRPSWGGCGQASNLSIGITQQPVPRDS